MQQTWKIQCDISSTNPDSALQLEIWINNEKILDSQIVEPRHFEYRMPDDDDGEYELKFLLKNKKDSDTTVDELGNILHDSLINISNIKVDDIEVNQLMYHLVTYTHDNNGHGPVTENKFFGTLGCNGTATLKFTTPIYLWLLENM
jgi:hypothetical protein